MGRSQREKGKAGEREAAHLIRDSWGIEARRGRQYRGSDDSPDVICVPGLNVEVKRREAGNPGAWLEQAQAEAGDALAVVLHKRNGKPWLLTLQADRLMELIALVEGPK